MQIDLIVRKESDPNSYTITCDVAERLVFGRSVGSPVNLAGSEISREHFALLSRNGEIRVQDLSSNGTTVNGKPIPQKKPLKLNSGDIITVPGYEIELRRRIPMTLRELHHSPQETFFRWNEFLNLWEVVVIAAAIASFALIICYVAC